LIYAKFYEKVAQIRIVLHANLKAFTANNFNCHNEAGGLIENSLAVTHAERMVISLKQARYSIVGFGATIKFCPYQTVLPGLT